MAASIKVSELQSLTQLSDVDLFLVTDTESSTSRRVSYGDLKVNLTTNLLTAISDLNGTVQTNSETVNSRIDSEVATLTTLIADRFSDADSAIAAEQARALAAEVSILESIDTHIATVQGQIDNLEIDIAPETLNSINELAGALGDNPDIITELQTRIATDEAALANYKLFVDDMNLQLALAYDTPLYIDSLFGG